MTAPTPSESSKGPCPIEKYFTPYSPEQITRFAQAIGNAFPTGEQEIYLSYRDLVNLAWDNDLFLEQIRAAPHPSSIYPKFAKLLCYHFIDYTHSLTSGDSLHCRKAPYRRGTGYLFTRSRSQEPPAHSLSPNPAPPEPTPPPSHP